MIQLQQNTYKQKNYWWILMEDTFNFTKHVTLQIHLIREPDMLPLIDGEMWMFYSVQLWLCFVKRTAVESQDKYVLSAIIC